MALYRSDWECTACENIVEHVIKKPDGSKPPKMIELECFKCGHGEHRWIISAPAKYLRDRPHNPMVAGGKFDTMGMEQPPEMPELPPAQKVWKDQIGGYAKRRRWDEVADVVKSKEWQERKAERNEVKRRNRLKKARAGAIRRGENVNMWGGDRLPGDPKI